eukprot:TRINITY_DN213_c0_g1_i1.p1 TRINITY_DN213_c0_g1~~TRINITY_DN213_c0_g1_i1.p1  ORF type:complete len:445 (+),score=112.61 TRINITY_DN213_c0_g1_i1:160-1494(+)
MGSLLDELLLSIDKTTEGKLTTPAKPIQRSINSNASPKGTTSPSSSPPPPEPPKKKGKYVPLQRFSPPKTSPPKAIAQQRQGSPPSQKQIAKESNRAKVTKVEEYKLPICRSDPVLVSTVKECEEAIEKLSKYKLVAFDCEAVGMNRHGKLCLVQIATEDSVYLFDITVGGDALFESGLRWLLETDKILKVGHDCRGDSDILWYQHQVSLARVFDTQVAFCVLCKQQGGSTPIPAALNTLIKKYAHGATNKFKDIVREEMESCDNYWEKRPLSHNMIQYASQDVIYLPFVWRQIDGLLSLSSKNLVSVMCQNYLDQYRSLKERPLVDRPASPKSTPSQQPSSTATTPTTPTEIDPSNKIQSTPEATEPLEPSSAPTTPSTDTVSSKPSTPSTPTKPTTPTTPVQERFIPKYGIEEWDKEVARNLELGTFRSGHLGGVPRRRGER